MKRCKKNCINGKDCKHSSCEYCLEFTTYWPTPLSTRVDELEERIEKLEARK